MSDRRDHARELALLAALIAVGTALRVWIAFTNRGVKYDIDSLYTVAAMLKAHPLHAYLPQRWPYPGGYLPVVLLCRWIADATGAQFYAIIKLPAILADAGLAAAVWWGLRELRPSTGPGARLLAAALIALGPSFILISGYHGQIDSAGILPALLAVIVWQRGGGRRALQAGLLAGLGASFKSVPLFLVLAMLPTARSRREAGTLLAAAIAVPLVSIVPFLAADPHSVRTALTANKGVPGFGGLSLFAEPYLIHYWLLGGVYRLSSSVDWLVRHQNGLVALAVLAAGAVAYRRRMPAVRAAALIWIAVYLANPDWSYQYFVWGLPFFLLAGAIAASAGLELLLALPAAELYFHFAVRSLHWAYLPLLAAAWAGLLLAGAWLLRRSAGHERASPPAQVV